MRKLLLALLMSAFLGQVVGQSYSYEMELKNVRQINETEIAWDVYIRKGVGSDDWALYSMQNRLNFNHDLCNGGGFSNGFFVLDASQTELYQEAAWFNNANVSVVSSGTQINWYSVNCPVPGSNVTIISDTWRKVATFRAQLRKDGFAHNFADVAHALTFESPVQNTLVLRCSGYSGSNPTAKMVGSGNNQVMPSLMIPTPGTPVDDRQLAGFCFSGTGDWSDPTRWNNVTSANANTLPGETNNAIINGAASLTDDRSLNMLTVAAGGFLSIGPTAHLTTNLLFNDNPVNGSTGSQTVAAWDFEGSGSLLPYSADDGSAPNIENALFNSTATFDGFYSNVTGNISRAPFCNNFRMGPGSGTQRAWTILFSTVGYQNLVLSSKQWSDVNNEWEFGVGPDAFSVQWSTNGTIWENVTGGQVTVSNDWTTGVVANLTLPEELNNVTEVYIRWLTLAPDKTKNGYSSIDDIVITGETLPVGLLIESTAEGTGSLIHTNAGVGAEVHRFLSGEANTWHMISSPVGGMGISCSCWDPGAIGDPNDFFLWDETCPGTWVNYKNQDGTGGDPSFPVANGGNNFVQGRGYIVDYCSPNCCKSYCGCLNAGTIAISLACSAKSTEDWTWQAGWNLVGNPYASGLDFESLCINGVLCENYAQIYDPFFGGGIGGYVQATTISPGQGFFVKSAAGAGQAVLSVSRDNQVHEGAFYKQGSIVVRDGMVIKLSDGQYYDEARVLINDASLYESDFYDATKLFSYQPQAPQLYTRVENGHPLSVNSIPQVRNDVVIPLSVKAVENSLMTLSIEEMNGTMAEHHVVLFDQFTQIYHQLDEGAYEFMTHDGDQPDRFVLSFGSVGIDNPELSDVKIYCAGQVLYIMNGGDAQFELINMAGQVVERRQMNGDQSYSCHLNLNAGTYVVRVFDGKIVSTSLIVL